MKRKIIKLGPATLVISLPSKWIKQTHVKPGDEIELEEIDNNLVIKAEESKKINKIFLDFTEKDLLMKRIFASKYLRIYLPT